MRLRWVTIPLALGAVSVMSLVGGVAAAQGPTSEKAPTTPDGKPAYKIPRTPDGHPDLQGVWGYANLTPMERPPEFAGKATITAEEAAAFDKVLKQRNNSSIDIELAYDARVWQDKGNMSRRTSLIVDPPDGRIPPLTPEGQSRMPPPASSLFARSGFDGPEDRTLGERCILGRPSGPPLRPETYNNTVQIFQSRKEVVLLNEMIHTVRVVPLDGRPRSGIRQWAGESLGRWEGDTLVIETTNFRADAAAFVGRGVASENLRLVERISRIDANTLSYEFTMDDPKTWVRTWTAQFPLRKETVLYETVCHEGNRGMFGILSGARAAEKAAARKK